MENKKHVMEFQSQNISSVCWYGFMIYVDHQAVNNC